MDKPPTEQHSDKLLPPIETSGRGETGQRKELLFSWLQTGNFCGKPYQCWREGGSQPNPGSQGSWVLASSRWGCSDHRRDLLRDPHETRSTSVISPAHFCTTATTQVLHLQDLLFDTSHQDLGASRDVGVGQQNPQCWHPGSNKTSHLCLSQPPQAPKAQTAAAPSASKVPFEQDTQDKESN